MIEHSRYQIKEHFDHGKKIEERTLVIYYDEDSLDPREEWDNFGHMICFHRNYNLGDKHNISSSDFSSWNDLENYLHDEESALITVPIYMYDHSGITIRAHSFNDCWDSGQIGFIYVTEEDIKKNFGIADITEEIKKRSRDILISEIETYDKYLRGDVFGFNLFDKSGDVIDSCWGYYDVSYILEECGFLESDHE